MRDDPRPKAAPDFSPSIGSDPGGEGPAPAAGPRRRRSKRGARVFLTFYLAGLIGMFALVFHILQSKGLRDWLMCLPILAVWLFIFTMALKELLKTFRRTDGPPTPGRAPAPPDATEAGAPPPSPDAEEDFARRAYGVLGLAPGADFADVKRAYRARLRDNDPDQYRDDPAARRRAEARVRELEGAFRLLEKRRR